MSHQALRVSLVMPSASPTGGAEEAFLQLLNSHAAKEVAWQAIFLEEGLLVDVVREHVDESFVVPCGRTRELHRWWRAASEIGRHAERFAASLIFGWMTKGHVYGGLAGWRKKIPTGWFQMGLPEDDLLGRMSRWLPARVVFACSEFVAREQSARQPRANVVPVPLGVDLSRFDLDSLPSPQEAREQLGLPLDGPLVGIVGRLQRWKGMHTLIAAMPAVLEAAPDAHCLIVGGEYPAEPEYPAQLRTLAKSLYVEDRVIFAGPRSDVPLWMQAMDIFVHASDREPFGIVVVEALALGKPVIACTPGGPQEILAGVPGCATVGFEDDEAMAAAIRNSLSQLEQSAEASAERCLVATSRSGETYASHAINAIRSSSSRDRRQA